MCSLHLHIRQQRLASIAVDALHHRAQWRAVNQTQQGVIYSRQNTQTGQTSQTGQNELEVIYSLQAGDRIGLLMRVEADSRDFTIVGASSFVSASKLGGTAGAAGPEGRQGQELSYPPIRP